MRGRGWAVLVLAVAGCGGVPAPDSAAVVPQVPVPVAAAAGTDLGPGFVPSLAPRPGRPCGDIVGISNSGPFAAGIVQLGESRSLTPATPEMEACVAANGLEVEFTSGG